MAAMLFNGQDRFIMRLIAAKRRLSSSPAIRQWRDTCAFACPTISFEARYEGGLDSLGTLEHGNGPGG
jgi:hypothetical protein